jgi:ATP-dependent DNA helicase RecG
MNADLLDRILEAVQVGETTDWEFKSAKGGFPGSFWETYSAMANSEGGVVVLGVREQGSVASLDGLTMEQIARYQKTLWDGLNNRGQVSLNLLELRNVEVAEVAGAALLVIRIPRASRTQRPVYAGTNPFGSTHRRRHEGDYRCTGAEVRRMLSDADEMPPDHRILAGFSMDDIDVPSLAQYRQRLRAAKGEHPWVALSDRDLLERLGGWRHDRSSGDEGLTLAGLLMFGRDQAIRDPNGAPNYFVDYREKLDPALRWTDRMYPDGTWEANLFQFYSRVWTKLASGLPTPFQLEGAMRRDVTPAHEALREAFVNAIIHADYAGAGGVVVERYPDRFIVENPGTLLVSVEQYLAGGVSECRNKSLQQMFLMIGGGERAGSGADKIRAGWRAQHWRAPRLEVRSEPDRVRLTLPMISLIPAETLDRLRHVFGSRVDVLAPAELQALATADVEGSVSNVRLQELLTDHPVEITRMLSRLCEQGYLISDNKRRWTTYRITSPGQLQDSSHLPWDSSHKRLDSSHKSLDSSHKEERPARRPWEALSPEEQQALSQQAEVIAKTQRARPEAVRQTILELCRDYYLTVDQLAALLSRNTAGLRDRYLTPMTKEGLLRLRYPEAPNRPDQAYTSADTIP